MTSTDDREALAAHLSVEEFEDGFIWPEHVEDDGYRGGSGYVRIAPSDIQARRREAADRILILLQQRGFARASPPEDAVSQPRREDDWALTIARSLLGGTEHAVAEALRHADACGYMRGHEAGAKAKPHPDPTTGGEAPGRDEQARRYRFRRQEAAIAAFVNAAPLSMRIAAALDAADAVPEPASPRSSQKGEGV